MGIQFHHVFLGLSFFLIISCQEESAGGVQEITKKSGDYGDIIRIEDSMFDEDIAPELMAHFEFEVVEYDFGQIQEGEQVSHTFVFKNAGKRPLIIGSAKSTCGCTVPNYPKEPIAPGESGEILIQFDSKGRKGPQDKPITLFANTKPNKVILKLKGFVN